VAGDLARLLSEWIGPDPKTRAEALDAYASIRRMRECEWTLIGTFDRSAALLGAGHWVRWRYVEGRTFRDHSAVRNGLERGLARLASLEGESTPLGSCPLHLSP
jgi:homoserine kinase type II